MLQFHDDRHHVTTPMAVDPVLIPDWWCTECGRGEADEATRLCPDCTYMAAGGHARLLPPALRARLDHGLQGLEQAQHLIAAAQIDAERLLNQSTVTSTRPSPARPTPCIRSGPPSSPPTRLSAVLAVPWMRRHERPLVDSAALGAPWAPGAPTMVPMDHTTGVLTPACGADRGERGLCVAQGVRCRTTAGRRVRHRASDRDDQSGSRSRRAAMTR